MTTDAFTSAPFVVEITRPSPNHLDVVALKMEPFRCDVDVPDDELAYIAPKATRTPFEFSPHISLSYTDFSSSIHSRSPLHSALAGDDLIYNRVIHPYSSDVFEHLLNKHNLTSRYPLLVRNLRCGFPLGTMPKLEQTVIVPNHPSVTANLDAVHEYLSTELGASRMSGPYTLQDTERILRGPFYSSPLIVAVQEQGNGLPPKRRVCRNLSRGDRDSGYLSINSFINKEDFPTRFDMAFRVADAVSSHSFVTLWRCHVSPHSVAMVMFMASLFTHVNVHGLCYVPMVIFMGSAMYPW